MPYAVRETIPCERCGKPFPKKYPTARFCSLACQRADWGDRPLRHGHAVGRVLTGTYVSWKNMLARCGNPSNPDFKYYGGRGITVCDRWRGERGFENFLADMGPRPAGLTLDRIDNDAGYGPGNCRWATRKLQRANQGHHAALTRRS